MVWAEADHRRIVLVILVIRVLLVKLVTGRRSISPKVDSEKKDLMWVGGSLANTFDSWINLRKLKQRGGPSRQAYLAG